MQIREQVKNCNGCGACVVGCKNACLKMVPDENGLKYPVRDENGCQKCNNCVLYCPLYNPVELPEFDTFFDDPGDKYYNRDMPAVYRETMRSLKKGEATTFIGTLCQIAALKSVMGDRLHHRLVIYPIACDPENPKRPECKECEFYKSYTKEK